MGATRCTPLCTHAARRKQAMEPSTAATGQPTAAHDNGMGLTDTAQAPAPALTKALRDDRAVITHHSQHGPTRPLHAGAKERTLFILSAHICMCPAQCTEQCMPPAWQQLLSHRRTRIGQHSGRNVLWRRSMQPSSTLHLPQAPSATLHQPRTIWHAPSGMHHLARTTCTLHRSCSIRHIPLGTLHRKRSVRHAPLHTIHRAG